MFSGRIFRLLLLLAAMLGVLLLALTLGFSRGPTGAIASCSNTPVTQWPASGGGNDHFYQGVCAPGYISWDAAKLAAEATGGHLVTQTSSAENGFVFSLIDSPGFWTALGPCSVGPWIGLFQPAGSPEPAGGWSWVTGEPFVFSNWAANEPNNGGGNEDVALFWSEGGCPGTGARSAKWNDGTRDHGGLGGGVGYVIEWEQNPCKTSTTNGLGTCSMQPGDILLSHSTGLLYLFEHRMFKGYWTHAGIYNGDGTVTESSADCSLSGCGDTPGVEKHNIESSGFWTASDWAIVRPNSSSFRDLAIASAGGKVGSRYNWNYLDMFREDKFFCSQLVWWAYNTAGLDLNSGGFPNVPLSVPPDDLYHDNDVSLISERPGIGRAIKRTILRLLSPADLYITDSSGRHAGTNPATGEVVNEIPGVLYSGPESEPEVMSIEDMDATWTVNVTGTDVGSYTLEAVVVTPDDPEVTSTTGGTSPGTTAEYLVTYPDAPGEPISLMESGSPTPTPSATPTVAPTATPTPTSTPSPTPTPTPIPTPTPTPSPSPTQTPTSSPTPTVAPRDIAGDVDCDKDADSVDALFVLRYVAALQPTANCIAQGDVDCDGDRDSVDALKILRHVAGLPVNLPAGCPSIGSPIGGDGTPSSPR